MLECLEERVLLAAVNHDVSFGASGDLIPRPEENEGPDPPDLVFPDRAASSGTLGSGGVAPLAPQAIGTSFSGINLQDQFNTFGSGYIPPDTMGAVGPSHFVEVINGSVAIYTKTGTRLSHVSLNSFFTVIQGGITYPRNGAFDPRVIYDQRSGHWFGSVLEFGTGGVQNHIILAVSRTSDPTGTWNKYVIPVGVANAFTDFDTLCTDDNGVYFGMTIFPNFGGSTAKIAATGKASLLAPSPSLGTVYQFGGITDLYSSPQPACNLDPVAPSGRAWFVSSSTTVFGNVNYRTLTWSGGAPTLSSTSVLSTPGYAAPLNAPARGSATNIEVLDDRLEMAVIRNNQLWTVRDVGVNSSGGSAGADRTGVEWLDLNVSTATASLVQSGRVFDPVSPGPRFYYDASIMVSGQGHMAMGFSGSNSTEFVGAYTAGRLASDPLGTTGAVALLKAGQAAYQRTSGGRNRWGDYSRTTLDPNDDMTMWTIQEYATNIPSSIWGTWVTQLLAPAPTLTNPNGSGSQGQTSVSLSLSGTGLYDPGAGFANRLNVLLTGGAINGISNYVVTYNGPTSATVTFDIAADASPGFRNVVLTNPDGQSVTVVNGFNVLASGPSLSINDMSVLEVNSGTMNAVFTVSLSAASSQTVTVQYATADGTAVAPTDYTAIPTTTLTFAPGETTKTITVLVNGDTATEPDETFFVNLTNPTNATVADGQGTGTIINDDVSLSINNVSVSEGNSGTSNAVFTVTLSPAAPVTVTVDYATADSTATAGSDYTATSGALTFAPGVTTQTISVPIVGDTTIESDETFFVNLTNPTNATIADSQGIGTILNDDGGSVSISINNVSVAEGNAGTSNAVFTVSLSSAASDTVSVDYATANSTATAGSDYTATSGTLTFAPGVTTQTIAVPVLGDALNESDEIFFVNLSNPTNAVIGTGQGQGTIRNDDPTPSLSIGDVALTEGNSGTKAFTFTVNLSAASGRTVTVQFATANGTATAGSDYVTTSGTLTFAAGSTSRTISVTVNGDTTIEPDETFFVNLTAPVNAVLLDGQGAGTILNDDLSVSISNATVVEGYSGTIDAIFTVNLSAAASFNVTVNYATAGSTATSGSDFVATSGTLTFTPGMTTQTVTVLVVGDRLDEMNETFFVNLSKVTGATIATAQGVGTIQDDDPAPSLSINDVSLAEGNSGTTSAVFIVSLLAASGQTVTVQYATAAGTATAGSDYQTASGTLSFYPGATTRTVSVTVNGDTTVEPTETFFVNLSNPTNATLADNQGQGTILNDDPNPLLSIAGTKATEGDTGTKSFSFAVTLSAASSQTVTVNYATADGTATAGSDYVTKSGTLTFAAGVTTQTISVTVNGDTAIEPDETFAVNLSNPSNATLGTSQSIGNIQNDDTKLSINNVSVTEGNAGTTPAVFTVSLSAIAPFAVSVSFATADGPAVAGSDYIATGGTVTFAPGDTTKTITVLVVGDMLNETDEFFRLNISSPINAIITAPPQGRATIVNDDPLPSLSLNDVLITEGNSGTKNAVFTVSLSAASGQTVTVQYATADATATAGTDYTAASGTLSFSVGQKTKTISVPIIGDMAVEPDESFVVNLSNPVAATIPDNQGLGTILNDDTLQPSALSAGRAFQRVAVSEPAIAAFAASSQEPSHAHGPVAGNESSSPIMSVPANRATNASSTDWALSAPPNESTETGNGDGCLPIPDTVLENLGDPLNENVSELIDQLARDRVRER